MRAIRRRGVSPIDPAAVTDEVREYLGERLAAIREQAEYLPASESLYFVLRQEELTVEDLLERLRGGVADEDRVHMRRALDDARMAIDEIEGAAVMTRAFAALLLTFAALVALDQWAGVPIVWRVMP